MFIVILVNNNRRTLLGIYEIHCTTLEQKWRIHLVIKLLDARDSQAEIPGTRLITIRPQHNFIEDLCL